MKVLPLPPGRCRGLRAAARAGDVVRMRIALVSGDRHRRTAASALVAPHDTTHDMTLTEDTNVMQHSHQLRAAMGRVRALRVWRTWAEDAVRTHGTHENIDCHRRRWSGKTLGGRAEQQTRAVRPVPCMT